jgi:protein tyrosine/serine phosphatase
MDEFAPGLFRSGIPSLDDLSRVKSVINLETSTRELIFGGANLELVRCLEENIRLYDFAFSGIFPPDARSTSWIRVLLKEEAPRPVLLHCRHGRERTGFIAAVYRMQVQGWTFEKAYQEWRDTGCRWVTWKLWKRALRKWEVRG